VTKPDDDSGLEEEEEDLAELLVYKLESAWRDCQFLKKLQPRLSSSHGDEVLVWTLYCFAAERAAEIGQTREDFVKAMGDAFDEVATGEQGEPPGEGEEGPS
jgi:hypothetical protein